MRVLSALVLVVLMLAGCTNRTVPMTGFEASYYASGGGIGGLSASTLGGLGMRQQK